MYKTSHMCILLQDVGFDYQWKVGKDNQVIDVYFHHHFPKAVRPHAPHLQGGIQQDYQSAVTIAFQLLTICGSSGLRFTSQKPSWLLSGCSKPVCCAMQINTSRELRARGGPERYKYMTQAGHERSHRSVSLHEQPGQAHHALCFAASLLVVGASMATFCTSSD